jgi:hypothetical protein
MRPFIFTDPAKASAAGKRSGESRRNKALERLNCDKPPAFDTVQAAINAQVNLVADQITRTRDVLNDDKSEWCPECERGGIPPHHRAQLLKALDTLLDRQRELLGLPKTGSKRPSSRDDRRRMSFNGPMPIQPQPPAAPACGVAAPIPAQQATIPSMSSDAATTTTQVPATVAVTPGQ